MLGETVRYNEEVFRASDNLFNSSITWSTQIFYLENIFAIQIYCWIKWVCYSNGSTIFIQLWEWKKRLLVSLEELLTVKPAWRGKASLVLGTSFLWLFCTAVVTPAEELKSILSKDYVEKLFPPKWKIETFPCWLASADCSEESLSNIENFSDLLFNLTFLSYNFHFEAKSFFHLIISLFYFWVRTSVCFSPKNFLFLFYDRFFFCFLFFSFKPRSDEIFLLIFWFSTNSIIYLYSLVI